MTRRILLTGGSGMVGGQWTAAIRPTHKELDILDIESVRAALDLHKPDCVVHLAANVDMVDCEQNVDRAYMLNVLGSKNVAQACSELGIQMVYMSTCAVFDGKKATAYTENDMPNPISQYGLTKWIAELVIRAMLPDALIVRTGWLFGGGAVHDTKFAYAFWKKLELGEQISAVSDRYGSPTYIPDLLGAIDELIAENATGIVHIVNTGVASYSDVARLMADELGKSELVSEVSRDSFHSPAPRGIMEGLASKRISLRPWGEAMTEYIATLKHPQLVE